MKSLNNEGFTLIELLVVISIIGLLSSVVMVSVNSARAKARDAKRMADIRQLLTAIDMYYQDKGVYPPPEDDSGPFGWNQDLSEAGSFIPALVQTGYISKAIKDPLGGDVNNMYIYMLRNGVAFNNTSIDSVCGAAVQAKGFLQFTLEKGPSPNYKIFNGISNVVCIY